jgi:hypothetical protein
MLVCSSDLSLDADPDAYPDFDADPDADPDFYRF